MKPRTMSFCPLKRKLCGEADYTGATKDGICSAEIIVGASGCSPKAGPTPLQDIKICPKDIVKEAA